MPKLKLNPVDHAPPPPASAMLIKLFGVAVITISLLGVAWMLLAFSEEKSVELWDWSPKNVKTNFSPVITKEQRDALLNRNLTNPSIEIETEDPGPPETKDDDGGIEVPGDGGEVLPVPPSDFENKEPEVDDSTGALDRRHNLELARKLKPSPAFDLVDEAQNISGLTLSTIDDSDQTKLLSEHRANEGRQQPGMERLALQVLNRISEKDLSSKLQTENYFFGKHNDVVDKYRGLVFNIDGRLFDLYEHKLAKPIVLNDGKKVSSFYEGVVCYLNEGSGRNDVKVQQRTIIFQTLTLPDELKKFLNDTGNISHDDNLSGDHVRVKLNGTYLRRWIYSREVKPFSLERKRVYSQAVCPLLLAAEVSFEGTNVVPLTDELLQQVRDSINEDPRFLETEGAYYALLALANSEDDEVEIIDEISYFDLAGQETGPKYRSKGVHIQGMIGNDYHPVIFPPNISGLRRIFRAYLLADMYNVQSEKRFLIDMIEPPSGLEPQALVDVKARYYRNVFEAKKTSTMIRPLLIVKKMTKYSTGAEKDNWYYSIFGLVGIVLVLGTISFLVLSDRKERASFEKSALELTHDRIRKRGGLKLKPLPGKPKGGPVEPDSADNAVSEEKLGDAADKPSESNSDGD